MRTPWLLLALLAFAGAAQGSDAIGYQSGTNQCAILAYEAITPPSLCPHVDQSGTATLLGCAGDRCTVRVDASALALGVLPAAQRALAVEAQIADASEPAAPACSVLSEGPNVACDGAADLDLPVAAGACTLFRVRAALSDLGADGVTFVYRLATERELQVCRDLGGSATISLG